MHSAGYFDGSWYASRTYMETAETDNGAGAMTERQATDIVVIGGGIIGIATAYRLAQGGASVTLLEAGRIGGGTSGNSYA